ncbi:uncharacterized protein LOC126622096 isoform X2 [Malus sylvestris]|uniref:uncharacterized protein LOC126622096 isoform X2 n=1 Tax=Malus sylvestris TaxID=3752 RepID=UPI0021ACB901|nr:uncharacterized protein LOC126622096 isoform X2 [Malus sylvestris]
MASNSILCCSSHLNPSLFVVVFCLFVHCYSYGEQGPYNSFTVSSFSYPPTKIGPSGFRYIRVEMPPWFSSIAMNSNVELAAGDIEKVPKVELPLICFRAGSLPLPYVNTSLVNSAVLAPLYNGSYKGIQALQSSQQCYPMQKNFTLKLTNEQISPGVWYFGLFNGIGPTRTQSKMINRAPSYSFSANITVEGCTTLTMWGPDCNQTINTLSCAQSNSYSAADNSSEAGLYNQTIEYVISCKNNFGTCHGDGEPKFYSLDVVGVSHELKILAKDVWLNVTSSDNTKNVSDINLMFYARHGALPTETVHDYSSNINKSSLVIQFPKVGRWYVTVLPLNVSKELEGSLDTDTKVCYSLESKLLECPEGKAGANCTWEMYTLQTSLRKGSSYFEYYYLLISEKVPPESANFPLDRLLTNSSHGGQPEETWTYFVMDIPRGAAGGHMHIRLNSDDKVNYEVYARYGGLPSLASWDYFYSNRTSSSHGSMFFNLYNSSEDKVDFYILYIREGTWGFGLKHLITTSDASKVPTIMSVSLERCPRRCSSHGKCETALDASGLASYSFCSCDPDHGGFDCSIELVTPHGHVWQSIFLIASNAAAALPAFWALRQKALAEWVIFTSSGIASGIYHACDVGTWCPLAFGVLQFMDVWLSFMAVGSTFVYLGTVEDDLKRALHTAVALLTALMVYTKARRPGNIILVIVIGTIALLIGWLIELSTKFRSFSFSTRFSLNMLERLQAVNGWLKNLIKTTFRRFRWGFILAGLVALAIAASSWVLETNESYWIWHSIWHMTIYTSSFFFLCSKESPASTVDTENQIPPNGAYELTRQDSFSRGE